MTKGFLQSRFFIFVLFIGFLLISGCGKPRYKKGTPATMKRYKIHGRYYTPTYVKLGQKMHGVSSWYGRECHGQSTSNGECYNMLAKTAAHKTWPMDTMVKVSNLENGRSTIVRINDRGPFAKGRIIDCSYAAGRELGLHAKGTARVTIEVVGFGGKLYPKESKKRILLTNFGVQVGAFSRLEGAQTYRDGYALLDPRHNTIIRNSTDEQGNPLYRVWLMGFANEEEAKDFINKYNLNYSFVVRE